MTTYNYAQLQALWIQNGGSATTAPMAAAIALAESGGNSQSHSSTNDFGLWQINNGGPAMYDPNANAKTAIQMSNNGVNWRPWCTAYADSACGTRGGAYLGANAPFWKYLTGAPPQGVGGSFGQDTQGGQAQLASASNPDDGCVFGLPLPSLGPIGGGQACLLKKSQGRALLGAVCLAGGGFVMLVGAALILAGSRGASRILGVIPSGATQAASRVGAARDDKRAAAAEQTGRENAAAAEERFGTKVTKKGTARLGVVRDMDDVEPMSRAESLRGAA